MKSMWGRCALILTGLAVLASSNAGGAEPPANAGIGVANGQKQINLPLVPGVDEFQVESTTDFTKPFGSAGAGLTSGYLWEQSGASKKFEFFRVKMQKKDPAELLTATLLNRIAYGPTPDELARVKQMGPEAYLQEQLAPETIQENLPIDQVVNVTDWQYVTATGTASGQKIYLNLTASGDVYLDDIKLVRGNVPEAGANILTNGGFESDLSGWIVSANMTDSVVVSDMKKEGAKSLHLVAATGGENQDTSISRENLGLTQNQTYTLSYWYKPGTSKGVVPHIRLSGSGIVSSPAGSIATKLASNTANLNDLTAWHILHAVQSKKQLQEVLLQFLDNHFVTQYRKSTDYFDRYYDEGEDAMHATNLEYRELQRWRQALQNPQVTFHDLMKISSESPAMIIYLDTVNSKGNGANIANENYARELLELFGFGVDNGYDQNDITVMSRAWTGWSVRLVDPANEFNPFAPQSTTLRPGGTNVTQIDNLEGIWAFNYRSANHNNGPKVIFPGKKVPDRFGAPYAGRDYELRLAAGGGTDWQYVTMTGTGTSSSLYIYLTGPGDCYIDDIKIVAGAVPEVGVNKVPNGDFEAGLAGWTRSANMSASAISTDIKKSGANAMHVVASEGGTTRGSSIWRQDLGLTADQPYTLSFWFRPGANMNGNLVLRLSGNGIDSTPGGGTNSVQEGYTVLSHMADQPFTQEFISVKLCRLFVHEDFAHGYDFTSPNLSPEGRLVRECMRAWEDNMPKGQLRKVLEVIFNSELFRSQGGSMQKVKTPLEYTISAVRALRARLDDGTLTADTDGYSIRSPINRMGRMRLFDRDDPDGYPEGGAPWISAGTLTERLRFVQALLIQNGQNGKNDAAGNTTDPVKLLKAKLPQTAWNDASAVASYFLGLLYPSEGKANLDDFRREAVVFLNTADDGAGNSPFSSLVNTGAPYELRVRGLVAMLMTYQRFQEQ